MRLPMVLLLSLWSAAAAAQMNKCVDERKQVTYSNLDCEKQGLRSAGTVTQDRVTSMPFTEPQKPPAVKEPVRTPTPRDREEAESGGSTVRLKPNLPALDKPSK